VRRPVVVLACLLACVSGCWSSRYLAKQGVGQLNLLRARRKIADVLLDPSVADETKRRLRLARAARDFGVAELGLRGGAEFTRFVDSAGAPIAWNVTAAYKDRLEPHIHNFPIVGAIPYLGFFAEADAQREAARLRHLDLDVWVRPVAGYSTLGIMADPIYSSMLEGPDSRIVEVVLHEMTHATVYLPGHSDWNESLATVVGIAGAAQFFAQRGDAAMAEGVLADARKHQADEESFARFIEPVARALERLYHSTATRAQKLEQREVIFDQARQEFLRLFPPAPGKKPGLFASEKLNNAVIIGYTTYHRDSPEHHRLLERLHGNLHALIALYKHAVADEDDPIAWLATL
jgi:predicted aminopeptidase